MADKVRENAYVALRACRLWRAASDETVRRLAEMAVVADVGRGTQLAREGDAAERFGVVVAGKARVFSLSPDGRRVTLETLGVGEPLAALAALAGGRYPFNVDASTPGTIAWLPSKVLLELVASEPAVARDLISDLAGRVVHFTSVIQTLTLDVPSRLARYLFQRALQTGRTTPSGLSVDLGMQKNELADALGTVPETLSRAFAKLKAENILTMRGRAVTILDMRALAALGSGIEEG